MNPAARRGMEFKLQSPTTAQLREQARSAEGRGEYAAAADLYTLAVKAYPTRQTGALQQADIAALTARASDCRQMATEVAA